MSDEPVNGNEAEQGPGEVLDGHEIGVMMMRQLTDLVDSWANVLEAVAQNGVDPTPLLHTLARTLRATADELDPVDS